MSRTGWVGVDWGTRAIKLACLEFDGSHYHLSRRAVLRRAAGENDSAGNGPAIRPTWTSDDFPSGLIRERWFRRRPAACVLPMHLSDMRALEIPQAELAVQRAMAEGEIADALGEPVGSRVFDLWEAPPGASHRNAPWVQVFSTPESVAFAAADALARAGLECEILDGPPFVLRRAIQLADPAAPPAGAALDWGFGGAAVCFYQEGTPIYSRQLKDCGVGRMATAMAKSLGVTLIEAEEALIEHGLSNGRPGPGENYDLQHLASQVLAEPIQSLLEQLHKTLNYVQSEWPECAPSELWLFGGAAAIRNLPKVLAEGVGMNVRTWKLRTSEPTDSLEALFGPAAALSLLAWRR
jgi:Tfp pilus assembly PilM family ATPase